MKKYLLTLALCLPLVSWAALIEDALNPKNFLPTEVVQQAAWTPQDVKALADRENANLGGVNPATGFALKQVRVNGMEISYDWVHSDLSQNELYISGWKPERMQNTCSRPAVRQALLDGLAVRYTFSGSDYKLVENTLVNKTACGMNAQDTQPLPTAARAPLQPAVEPPRTKPGPVDNAIGKSLAVAVIGGALWLLITLFRSRSEGVRRLRMVLLLGVAVLVVVQLFYMLGAAGALTAAAIIGIAVWIIKGFRKG